VIDHTRRCIFVHIPKTAGNSVNRVFGIGWQDHKDIARYALEEPAAFSSYFKFAIVRNPWDRLLSDYNYQRKKSRPEASKLFLRKENGDRRSFREWLEAALADPARYPGSQWGGDVSAGIHRWSPQIDWLRVRGAIAVDEIIRLEELREDLPRIWTRLGLQSRPLPHRNRRFHWHYSWYYDEVSRRMVADYYAEDVDTFGYRFEGPNRVFSWSRKERPTRIRTPSLISSSCSP
jgi:chondroitin 4-sulfotransferase 11